MAELLAGSVEVVLLSSDDDEASPDDDPPADDKASPDDDPLSDALSDAPVPEVVLELAAFVRAALADDRSFFAQPEPLKWMAGVDSALRIVPSAPHEGQKRGPGSLMPWITSVRVRQFAQR